MHKRGEKCIENFIRKPQSRRQLADAGVDVE
jgi:hypothetical protein